jgi:hypothetical protein
MNVSSLSMRPAFWGACAALCALLVYVSTMSPTVGFIDSGELATVATTLGIAHPTGYPLFSMLGWIAAHIPAGREEIVRLNFLAAVLTASAVFFLFLAAYKIVVLVGRRMDGSRKRDELLLLSASASGLAILAFSETFWSQAVSVEVYSLHLLFVGAVLLMLLRAHEERVPGFWYATGFLLGLSFTNHMTTILLLPGVLYLYFAAGPSGKARWSILLSSAGFFLLGLTPYLYLPLRAAQSPVMNWGNPVDLERLLWHVSGKQFRVWIFSSPEVAGRQFRYFISELPVEFAVIGLVFGGAGLAALWRAHRKLALMTVIFFATCVAYAVNYDISDIDSYFLLAYICIGLWSACGVFAASSWVVCRLAKVRPWVAICAVMVGMIPMNVHYRTVDESRNYLVEDYTRNMFASLRPGAVVFSYQWDYWVSASYYYQLVRGERTDIAVIDKELLRRSWYYHVLEGRYPWLIRESRAEVDAFLNELYKFEHELPYSYQAIEGRYAAMIRSFIDRSMVSRPVYVTPEIEPQYTGDLRKVPEGLAFRLLPKDAPEAVPEMPEFKIRPFSRKGRLEDMFWAFYARAYYLAGEQFQRAGQKERADDAFFKSAGLRSGNTSVLYRGRAGG